LFESLPAPPPEPPGFPPLGPDGLKPDPPPADVIVENVDGFPLAFDPPPPPTVIGYP
jgi:hypothetical protein